MRLAIPLCCLFLGPLACNSASEDPEGAARAAKSAASALKPVGKLPSEPGVIQGDDDSHPGVPGKPGDYEPPPSVGSATCIVDDGDDSPTPPDDDDVKKPGPKGPKGPAIDLETKKLEKAKVAGKSNKKMAKSAPPPSLDGEPTSDKVQRERVDWGSLCESRMSADDCRSLCSEKDLTWDASAQNNGTCFQLSSGTAAQGGTTSVQCGCMCLPGS